MLAGTTGLFITTVFIWTLGITKHKIPAQGISTVSFDPAGQCVMPVNNLALLQALHCTALHCTALHCSALHSTALHCTALHMTILQVVRTGNKRHAATRLQTCTVYSEQCSEHCLRHSSFRCGCFVRLEALDQHCWLARSCCSRISSFSVHCTVYSVQCTVYSVQCTVYSFQ